MTESHSPLSVRRATVADAATIAHHRARMFEDMGTIAGDTVGALRDATHDYLLRAIPAGDYLGWLMYQVDSPTIIAAGAGLAIRQLQPFAHLHGALAGTIAKGKQGLIVNVYVEPQFRRRGLARTVVQHIMDFATSEGVESLVLHASKAGRPLYEQLGFAATNEMRLIPK